MKQVEYYKNGNRTLRIKYEGIKKLLEKQDKEIERLNNRIDKAIYMIEDLMANNLEVHKGEPIIKVLKGE